MPDTSSGLEFEDTVETMLNRILPVVHARDFGKAPYTGVGKDVAIKKAKYKSSMRVVPVGADPVTAKTRFATSTAEFMVHRNGRKLRIEAKSMKGSGSVDEKVQKLINDVKVPSKGYDELLVITSGVTNRFLSSLAEAARRRSDIKLFRSVKELRAYLTA